MSRDEISPSLRHDLLGALSAVQMNLETLQVLETGDARLTQEKRLAVIQRALTAIAEAVVAVKGHTVEGYDSLSDSNR